MRTKSYWWPLAKNLVEYLKEQTENGKPLFNGIDLYAGTRGNARDFPCIEVELGSESSISVAVPTNANVELWLTIYVQSDNDNTEAAYKLFNECQGKIFGCIEKWPPSARNAIGAAPNVKVEDIVSDGGVLWPVQAMRIILNIEWRKT